MPLKDKNNDSYMKLNTAIASRRIGRFYIFHGDERYLLEYSLGEIRKQICTGGLDSFNFKRFDGKDIKVNDLEEAINALPTYAERTLIELHDFDVFKSDHKQRIRDLLSDLPDYVCIVVNFDTIPYKPDGRVKLDKEILKKAEVVEFNVQEQDKLIKWITRHFSAAGKRISTSNAEYLILITGGFMSSLNGEIEKVTAYAPGDTVTRADIDAVVIPVLDAVTYKLTDAVSRREYARAMRILDELLRMREAPHKLIFSISLTMRQLLAARVCIEENMGKGTLKDMCGIWHESKARVLLDTARGTTLEYCRRAVLLCSQTAYELNSSPEPEARLTELILKLAFKD